MPDSTAPIAWIDVETSGIDPTTHDLLEIAAVVTTGPGYTPADEGISVTIHPQRFAHLDGPAAVEALKPHMLPLVVDMHASSGLFDDIASGNTLELEDADRQVRDYLARHFPARGGILGGNSITLDRNFLDQHAPATFAHLHYRSLDCTSLFEFVRRLPGVGPDWSVRIPREEVAHRALADVRESIRQAEAVSAFLADGVPQPRT